MSGATDGTRIKSNVPLPSGTNIMKRCFFSESDSDTEIEISQSHCELLPLQTIFRNVFFSHYNTILSHYDNIFHIFCKIFTISTHEAVFAFSSHYILVFSARYRPIRLHMMIVLETTRAVR